MLVWSLGSVRFLRLCAEGPGETHDPSEDRPSEEQVDDKNGCGVTVAAGKREQRWQHVEGDYEELHDGLSVVD